MDLRQTIIRILRALFRKEQMDQEMDEEMRFHLEMRTRKNLEAGMSAEEARYRALRCFGGLEQVKGICRDLRGVGWIEALWRDVRFGLRLLGKNPGFTAVATLTLALGIGANTAIFSFLDRILWRSLPVASPGELFLVKHRSETGETGDAFIYPLYTSLRDQTREVFSGLIAYWQAEATLTAGNSVRQVGAMAVSSDYFAVLGVKPVLGRAFLPGEDQSPGAHAVVIISHRVWQHEFDGDPAVVGKALRLNDSVLTVVGVAPREFTGTYAGFGPAVYLPLGTWAHLKGISLDKREYDWLNLLGRLNRGVAREQAQALLRVVAARVHAVEPINTPTDIYLTEGSRGTNVWLDESLWWPFALVQAATGLLLLVACTNVANLQLVRGAARQKELAIRRAIGASRRALIRQLMVESAVLALVSGATGVLLARWLTQALRGALVVASMANTPVELDTRVLFFGLLISFATALACGLVPALRASRPDLVPALNDSPGILTLLTRRWSLRHILVVTQVAVTLIVLGLGALCVRSLEKLRLADPGFDADRILAASVDFTGHSTSPPDLDQLFMANQERVSRFQGVETACLAASVPLTMEGRNKTGVNRIDHFELPPDQPWLSLEYELVGPGYFRTLGVPLLRGRDFNAQDKPGAPKVMIVNELFAQRFWPNRDPIGLHVTFKSEVREVVGVVKTTKICSIRESPIPMMFWPLAQPMDLSWLAPAHRALYQVTPILLVRAKGRADALTPLVRKEMESSGFGPAVSDVRTLPARISNLLTPQRLIGGILNICGALGLVFAATGMFAIMAYEVRQRTREIGIRMALGAQWHDVRQFIMRKAAVLTLAGLALGLGLSILPMRLLAMLIPEVRKSDQYFLQGVHAWDPWSYVWAAILVILAALVACWIPARRAAKVAPMVALRYE